MKNISRIVIPRNVDVFFELCKNIIRKHESDNPNSPLKVVNMAEFQEKYTLAVQKHNEAERLVRLAKIATEQRNILLGFHRSQRSVNSNTLLYFITSARDILLGVYKGEEPVLGGWGFEVSSNKAGTYRVAIPYRKVQPLITLAEDILEKHTADGAGSLLAALDMATFAYLLADAKKEQKKSARLHRLKEIAYKERDNVLGKGKNFNSSIAGTLQYYVRVVRNVLAGVFRSNDMELGLWGFEVNTSPRRKQRETETEKTDK